MIWQKIFISRKKKDIKFKSLVEVDETVGQNEDLMTPKEIAKWKVFRDKLKLKGISIKKLSDDLKYVTSLCNSMAHPKGDEFVAQVNTIIN